MAAQGGVLPPPGTRLDTLTALRRTTELDRPMSQASTLIVGSYLSPYVRKVLVCLALKGVAYRIDPIVPSTATTTSPASARCGACRC
jgi:hypothetical protein